MNISGIYCIENIINGKKYIGSSINCRNRFKSHKSYLRRNCHQNYHLQLAWNKYGEINFLFKIILVCKTNELDDMEMELIKKHRSFNRKFGYNIDRGGTGSNRIISEETRNKISLTKKLNGDWGGVKNPGYGKKFIGYSHPMQGKEHNAITKSKISRAISELFKDRTKNPMYGKKHSEESKLKIRKTREKYKGKNHPMYGKKLSLETRMKISRWHMGKKATRETREKMSKTRTGKSFSEEHKKNLSLSLKIASPKGKNHPNYGKHPTKETRDKIRIGRKLAWKIKKERQNDNG